ncbi:hypothetical protein EG329_011131 [Mollisiaceae sp. DMI_Dod_QoI]|nr:hypothetical protein EG329_011131 [Helotiales sp. DMI_Dod_QoI]
MTRNIRSLQYESLANSEIRLLEIIYDGRFGRVRCNLSAVSLDDNPVYSALSYVWGEPTYHSKIIVNGHAVPVTRTLERALRHVRFQWTQYLTNRRSNEINNNHPMDSLRLWVDALCINQEDPIERSVQVQLMGRIYSSAQLVVAWLGDDERQLPKAFKAIETIAFEVDDHILEIPTDELTIAKMVDWLKKYPKFLEVDRNGAPPRNGIICAIETFFKLPYWERAWIMQERTLAKDILFITSTSSLAWAKVYLVTLWLEQLQNLAEETDASIPLWLPTDIWSTLTGRGYLPFEKAADTWKYSRESGCFHETITLWESSFVLACNYKATNAKDHIYGFLGLLGLDIKPDYTSSTSTEDVYRDYTKGWLAAMRDEDVGPLRFLSLAGIGHWGEKPRFATWIPDFAGHSQITSGEFISLYEGVKADKGLFSEGDESYPYIEGSALFVSGVKVDSVASVSKIEDSTVNQFGPLLNFTANYVARHSVYLSGIPPLQAVFRVATEDATPVLNASSILAGLYFLMHFTYFESSGNDQKKLMPTLLRLFGYAQQHKNSSLDEYQNMLPQLLRLLGYTQQESSSLDEWLVRNFFSNIDLKELGFQDPLSSYLDPNHPNCLKIALRMKFLMRISLLNERYHWQLAETINGYLCRLPSASKPGDLVCVLKGSAVPVILREVDGHYVHVGTAFVVGLMDGEAAKLVDESKLVTELFELR